MVINTYNICICFVKISNIIAHKKWGQTGHVPRIENIKLCTTAYTCHPGWPKTTLKRSIEQEKTKLGWSSLASASIEWQLRRDTDEDIISGSYVTGHAEDW